MKKPIIILVFACICSCSDTKVEEQATLKEFVLSGKIDGDYTDYIFLGYGDLKDSTLVKDGEFEFRGEIEKPTQGWVHLRPDANVEFVYLEHSEIELELEYQLNEQNNKPYRVLDLKQIEGSETALLQDRYRAFLSENNTKDNFGELLFEELMVIMDEYAKHPYSGKILGDLSVSSQILTYDQVKTLYGLLDIPSQHQWNLDMIDIGLDRLVDYGLGVDFPEFTLSSLEGEAIKLEDYKGKITLLDFWASWCGPCRVKHPDMIELYNAYSRKDFDILSISIDDDKEDWQSAIAQDGLSWNNVLDADKNVSEDAGAVILPYNYLIDEDGRIIGVNLPLDRIEKILTDRIGI